MVRGGIAVRPMTAPDDESRTAVVRTHYDEVLSPHYSRLFGDFGAKVAEQRALLERLGVTAATGDRVAVDLGCGSGFQSLALARLGYRVVAIDLSRRLVDELKGRAAGLPIETVVGDLREVARLAPGGASLVVCMGDTLSHLQGEDDLRRVLEGAATRLPAGGRLILTFRDLSVEARDLDRVIPVHASDDLIVTCVLEYESRTVKVHDLVWTRGGDGWRLQKGMYRKLRLAASTVSAHLERAGFGVQRHDAPSGLVALVGIRA
jgi:SAM-dependent methyltransferase